MLGSAGTVPHADNPCSGYLVRTPTTTVWLDQGSGTFSALLEHVTLAEVDALVCSHEHPDHCLELPLVRNAAKYVFGLEGIRVLGTAGTEALVTSIVGDPLAPTIAWEVITDRSEVRIGDLDLRFSRTAHPVETLAVRMAAGGRVAAFSADTGPGWSFAALDPDGLGFDLALCEATLDEADADRAPHLTAARAGAMADAAGVRRLALVHLLDGDGPRRTHEASATDAFDGPVELAEAGATFTV